MSGDSAVASIAGRALSGQPWCDALLREHLAGIPAAVAGLVPFRPRLLFLGGSAALGEAVGWSARDGGRFALSDLDLAVVTDLPVPVAVRREILKAIRAGEDSPVTLGFYETCRIGRQAPTPGLVDFARHGIPLWGEAGLLGGFLAPDPARIPPWEAFRLVGNRALELLAAGVPPSSGNPRAWYALGKAIAGLWTGWLVFEGRYRTGWAERAALLECPGEAPAEVVRAASAWRAFLARPALDVLPAADRGIPAYRAALEAWLKAAPGRFEYDGACPERPFLLEPCSLRSRLRLWRRVVEGKAAVSWRRGAVLRDWVASGLRGTPEGRRMAAAVLYWRLAPERPEPVWGDLGTEPYRPIRVEEWSSATARLLGSPLPAGQGSREGLRRLLAVLDPV
jgi:hypothetical protein